MRDFVKLRDRFDSLLAPYLADDGSHFSALVDHVLGNPRFAFCTASAKPEQHHYGVCGLYEHTLEVVELCLSINKSMNLQLCECELILSALYHDYGKTLDYVVNPSEIRAAINSGLEVAWVRTDQPRLVHHVTNSVLLWHDAVRHVVGGFSKHLIPVTHNILAHHGRREYGSPVAPKTKAAWLLHLCDSISARMSDADTLDLVHQ